MDLIEQAVFTSAETDRSAGYQVVADSPGLREADARELAVWGPSHDALLESTPGAVSFNFHRLSSGRFCVSRTTPSGWEYSGRGARVYTQCLIVPPETLRRFANNPFALLRAALAGGSLRLYDEIPKRLSPLRLAGRAAAVDSTLLARLCTNPGPQWLASLVQAALSSRTVGVVGGPPAEHVIAGLINCLPPECRTEFSFSTGLKFSSRRPFRVVALSGDRDEQRRVQRLYNLAVLDLSGSPPAEFAPIDSWARFIERVLKSGRTSLLTARLSNRQLEFAPEDLPALGLQLLEELDASSLGTGPSDEDPWIDEAANGDLLASDEPAVVEEVSPDSWQHDEPVAQAPTSSEVLERAHKAHRRFEGNSCPEAVENCKAAAPSKLLEPDSPEVLQKLEQLDDLVFEAIAGNAAAMEQLNSVWPQIRDELGDEMLAESREQYLRYALSIWEKCVEPGAVRYPVYAVQSLDVLCLLFDEA